MQTKKILISIAGIVVIALVAWGAVSLSKTSPDSAADISTEGTSTPVDVPAPVASSKYKNGSYSATGVYISPGGGQKVAVALILNNDIVTSLTVTPEPSDPQSAEYQNKFVSGIKQYVVGKNIDSVSVSRVSGSSLTSRGFNDALEAIKSEATA